ncbi:Predicted oxidoreductase [Amycolatopsis marina]|uniref:Predicted oxidoreductase n=1 Tax=Amycolatopsis marina TaxID=490629 RepID=A0A1I1BZD8_9PSEU|nr:aldo/keto reductase [Amycolatopsis marina]SFB55086.1 Predicted oxidoreductase [Amycolatopsis marina]
MRSADLSRVAIGLAALGRPAYINLGRDLPKDRSVASLRTTTRQVLDAAYERGVRRIDVARSYGLAEEFLGGWLADRGHRDVIVSSKWGYEYVGNWRLDAEVHESKEHSLTRFRTQWRQTRELLGDAVSLYQVHSVTPESPIWTDRALLAELAGLADSGVRVGISTSGPAQAEVIPRALALEVDGIRVFTAVQSTWNLLERSAEKALIDAHGDGVLVQLKETLANGRLAVDPPASVSAACAEHEVSPAAIAIGAALAQTWADVVLIGPSGTGQLADNLAALELDDVEVPAHLLEAPERYWERRSDLKWS